MRGTVRTNSHLAKGAAGSRSRERGIALLAVVAVLVLLAIIATPFLVTMRDGAARGKALLAGAEADMEARTCFQVAVAHLGGTDSAVERYAMDQKLKSQPATPEYDTLDEFQVPSSLLVSAGLDAESGRIWGVGVEDESAKINVNSAPFTTLGYFLGMTSLGQGLKSSDQEITLYSEGGLKATDGVVRIGDEVVKYKTRDGTLLRGVVRGYMAGHAGNGPARDHPKGELVVNETAFQIAAYPILARRGKVDGADKTEYAPYSNLYELRRISDLGVAALSADEWDRIVDCLTVSSRGVVGQTFGDPQTLRESIKAGQDGHKAKLKVENSQRYTIGTMVRVSDSSHTDYGIVYGYEGSNSAYVDIVPALQHDYQMDVTRVESVIRHPVNINTASEEVLTAMHSCIGRHGQSLITVDVAQQVAKRLIAERVKEREDKLPPGIRSLHEYRDILNAMVKEGSLPAESAKTCEMNALNPLESSSARLYIGSVPVDVRSGGIFTVTARAVVLDRTGREAGRRDFRRVVDVSPQGTSIYEIGGQAELDEVLRASSAKWFTTFPVNLTAEERGGAEPPSRFYPFFGQDKWPSTDRKDPASSLRLAPSRLDFGDWTANYTEPFHFDFANDADGQSMQKDTDEIVESTKLAKVGLVGKGDYMSAFSASLWFKPYWGGRNTAFVLDSGKDEWQDRIVLFYDGDKREMVFRVKDSSSQHLAAEVRYPFDKSTWEDDHWYHLHVAASGSKPGQMTMIIDGVKRGSPTLLTWTTGAIDTSTNVTSLGVEDASSFPDKGSVLLRGGNGVEVMEYDGKSSNALLVKRRFARMNRADTVDDSSRTIVRTFPRGTSVQLYGYSVPVTSVINAGSGSLSAALGRFNALVLNSPSPPDQWPSTGGGGGGGASQGGGGSGAALATGWRAKDISLNLASDVQGWNGDSGVKASAAFGGSGARGYALLLVTDHGYSPPVNQATGQPLDTQPIGGVEVLAYEISGGTLTLHRGVKPPPHLLYGYTKYGWDEYTNNPTLCFIPKQTYGDKNDKLSAAIKAAKQNAGDSNADGRIYRDDAVTDLGIMSVLVPISVEVKGADSSTFLSAGSQPFYTPRTLFAQIDTNENTEWFRYDSVVQDSTVSPNLLLVRDRSADRLAALLRTVAATIPDPNTPPPPPPPPSQPPTNPPTGGGGGTDTPPSGGPDTPPTPPNPGGGENDGPPSGTPDTPPTPPNPGGEGDGPPTGGPDTPPTPPSGGGESDGPPTGGPDTPPTPPSGGGESDGPPTGGGDTPPTPPPDSGGGSGTGTGTGTGTGGSPPDGSGSGSGSGASAGSGAGGVSNPGGTGSNAPIVPFNSGKYPDFLARFLDFRSTGTLDYGTAIPASTAAADIPVLIADISAYNSKASQDKTHASGAQVLPCFLVAFPGNEYDPQGNGKAVEKDLDDYPRNNDVAQGGQGPGAGPPGGGSGAGGAAGGSPAGSTDSGLMATVAAAPTLGQTGDKVEPGSGNLIGPYMEPGPGWNDEVTLLKSGENGPRETHVVNWSTRCLDFTATYDWRFPANGGFSRTWTWVAFKEPTDQRWSWNYDQAHFGGSTAAAQATDIENYFKGTMGDKRYFVRLVKSPSGELPARVAANLHVGADWTGEHFAKAVVDELRFTSENSKLVNKATYYLGSTPVAGKAGKGVAAKDANITFHVNEASGAILPPDPAVRESGGIIRIDDELIGYSDFDLSSQSFTGCERGAFGSEAKDHPYGSEVSFVNGIGVSRLDEGMTESSSRIPLASAHGFPIWGGFVRIGDEVLGYSRINADGKVLEMPEGRQLKNGKFDPYADVNQGAGIYRARYGTVATAHEQGALVYHLDHRYPDFSREMADHPQMAFYEVSRNVKGALWKRVSWDQRLRPLNGIRVLVRFEGGPAWDSDRIVRLDGDAVPETDRTKYLYEIRDPTKMNLLDVQSDRIECRVFFPYDRGAWNTTVNPSSDSWKETPWLTAFRMEYAAPAGVLTTEDLR